MGSEDHRSVDGGFSFYVVELVALEALCYGGVDEFDRVVTDYEASWITGNSKIGKWRVTRLSASCARRRVRSLNNVSFGQMS